MACCAYAHAAVAAAQPAIPAPPGAAQCAGCHGRGSEPSAIPRIHGRKAEQIAGFMKVFKSGKAPATVMDRIARGFTDDEIAAIAEWLSEQAR